MRKGGSGARASTCVVLHIEARFTTPLPPAHTHIHSLTSCCRAAAATPRAGARTSLLRRRSPLPRRAHRTSRPRRCLTAQIRRSPRQISPAAVLLASPTSALHVSRHSVHLCAQEHTMSKPNLDTDMLHGCAHVSALLHACIRATLSGRVYRATPIWDKTRARRPQQKWVRRRGAHSGPYHPLILGIYIDKF